MVLSIDCQSLMTKLFKWSKNKKFSFCFCFKLWFYEMTNVRSTAHLEILWLNNNPCRWCHLQNCMGQIKYCSVGLLLELSHWSNGSCDWKFIFVAAMVTYHIARLTWKAVLSSGAGLWFQASSVRQEITASRPSR